MLKKALLSISLVIIVSAATRAGFSQKSEGSYLTKTSIKDVAGASTVDTTLPTLEEKTLENGYHVFQTFNNCGPAVLAMALSYYGISETQENLGNDLRPYQNPQGDNDDKSVTLYELAQKSKEYNLIPFYRPAGNIGLIKQFITHEIPVITRTWLKENEDIGHYRLVKGYNDQAKTLVQDDSLQGRNLEYSYEEFNNLWRGFNFEYLVLVPKDKLQIVEAILGENKDYKKAWENAAYNASQELESNPDNIYSRFNLSVALYKIGEYKKAAQEFEKVEYSLPFRTLWYQIEPIQTYFELGNYQKVFSLTETILNNDNRAFSELYLMRGQIYLKQARYDFAKQEFEKAYAYNQHSKAVKEALLSL